MNMKKISIQKGLDAIETLLKSEGYDVVYYGENDMDAAITIMTGIDEAWEEIEPNQCRFTGDDEHDMLLIDATGLTPEQVLKQVKDNKC